MSVIQEFGCIAWAPSGRSTTQGAGRRTVCRARLLGGASGIALTAGLLAAWPGSAFAVDTTVNNAQGAQTVSGNDTLTVTGTGTVTAGTAVTWNLVPAGATGIVVSNAGTITGTTRAFDTTGAAVGARSFSLTNAVGGTITSGNDAFRINSAITDLTGILDRAD